MRIDILCRPDSNHRCDLALKNVRSALQELSIDAEVHLYRDRKKMIDNRVYVVPALMIDDQVRVAGRIPEVDEIVRFIVERPRYLRAVAEVA